MAHVPGPVQFWDGVGCYNVAYERLFAGSRRIAKDTAELDVPGPDIAVGSRMAVPSTRPRGAIDLRRLCLRDCNNAVPDLGALAGNNGAAVVGYRLSSKPSDAGVGEQFLETLFALLGAGAQIVEVLALAVGAGLGDIATKSTVVTLKALARLGDTHVFIEVFVECH